MPIRPIYVPEADLPSSSEALNGVLYVTSDTNKIFIGTGASLVQLNASGAPVVGVPGYFFPSVLLFTVFDPTNIDPRAGSGTLNNVTSWKQFYLPFQITITRYRFQCDGGTGTSGAKFYAGLADNSGNLIFDIGAIDLTPGAGQYGPGAVHDPGTVFFDKNRNPTNSILLQPGWYYYLWGASVVSGALTFPQMGDNSALWNEQINIDAVGLTNVSSRWAHSGSFDISGGHLPTTISSQGGAATQPPNITFFA